MGKKPGGHGKASTLVTFSAAYAHCFSFSLNDLPSTHREHTTREVQLYLARGKAPRKELANKAAYLEVRLPRRNFLIKPD